MRARWLAIIPLAVLGPTEAWADAGVRTSPTDVWQAWEWDPLVVFNLSVIAWLYGRGWKRFRRRRAAPRVAHTAQAICFYTSLMLIGLALLSPLDALAQELATAHMLQHMLLMSVAAPLFVLGSPALVLAHGMPALWRETLGLNWLAHRLAWRPGLVFLLFAVVLWVWHHPILYQAALRDPLVHDAQHLSFFAASFLFWRIVLDPLSRRRLHAAAATPYLFATSLHASLLGIFMALASAPWYPHYFDRTEAFGLTPLADQQLAGLIMWMPACLVYPVIAVALLGQWLARTSESPPIPARC